MSACVMEYLTHGSCRSLPFHIILLLKLFYVYSGQTLIYCAEWRHNKHWRDRLPECKLSIPLLYCNRLHMLSFLLLANLYLRYLEDICGNSLESSDVGFWINLVSFIALFLSQGYHGDTSKTFFCGDVNESIKRLVKVYISQLRKEWWTFWFFSLLLKS